MNIDRVEETWRQVHDTISTIEMEVTRIRGEIYSISRELKINDLPISNRSKNAMRKAFIEENGTQSGEPSITFMLCMSEKELKMLPGVGKAVMTELRQSVASLGLRIGMLKEMKK